MILGGILVGVTGVVLVTAFADQLPLLHRLPVVGATPPPSEVNFHIEGQDNLVWRPSHDRPADVVLSIGLPDERRNEVRGVTFNAYVVGATEITRCNQDGTPREDGSRLMGPDAPYWQASGLTIPPAAFIFFFKVRISAPGEYVVVFKFRSPEFYGKRDYEYRTVLRRVPA